jgi:hypothetical protein
VTDGNEGTILPQDLCRLAEMSQLRRHGHLTQRSVGRGQKSLDKIGIGISQQGWIVCSAVLAG